MKLLEWKSFINKRLFVLSRYKEIFCTKSAQTDIILSLTGEIDGVQSPLNQESPGIKPPLVKLFPGPPPFRSNNVL